MTGQALDLVLNKRMHDNYTNELKAIVRLRDELEEHGKLIIAFDFDNTIYDYHGTGLELENTIELLKRAKDKGHELYCFTANVDHDLVRSHVEEVLGIKNIAINESSIDHMFDSRKPFYSILLDDRAGLYSASFQLAYILDL